VVEEPQFYDFVFINQSIAIYSLLRTTSEMSTVLIDINELQVLGKLKIISREARNVGIIM
jgi:hypothetical protein